MPLCNLNCFACYLSSKIFHNFPSLGKVLNDTRIYLKLFEYAFFIPCCPSPQCPFGLQYLPPLLTCKVYAEASSSKCFSFIGKVSSFCSSHAFCIHPSEQLSCWVIIVSLYASLPRDFKLFNNVNVHDVNVIIFIKSL